MAEAADLLDGLKRLLLRELQALQQPVQLKAHCGRAGKFSKLALDYERPLATGGSRGKRDAFKEQKPLDTQLHRYHVFHEGVAQ